MPRQGRLNFSTTYKRPSSVVADKAPEVASAKLSRDEADAMIASPNRTALLTPPSTQSAVITVPPSTLAMESSFDLPDSTDWVATSLPAFEPLEAALRCEICKEFYENPVITTCSHTFCSLCIRRCIASDGKCPTCKSPSQADKLLPNNAVRQVVDRFQEARPKALELAKHDKNMEDAVVHGNGRKRKLEDKDIDTQDHVRKTRSRQSRGRGLETNGPADTLIEVPDSEEDGDEDFVPDGLVRCPICQSPMKEELVFAHLNDCPEQKDNGGGRSTRSRTNNGYPKPLQRRPKETLPVQTRLSGLNYALLTENNLKKKLKDLGIPNWGRKDILIRRHIEWLNLYNSNCDSTENRKSNRELLRELDVWERTQGGSAISKEAEFMKKDFDGKGHAVQHRSQFDDLIANAKKKREAPKGENTGLVDSESKEQHSTEPSSLSRTQAPDLQPDVDSSRPYEGNEPAMASVKKKVEDANQTLSDLPSLTSNVTSMERYTEESATKEAAAEGDQSGIQNHVSSPSRKIAMFTLPEEPIVDVENATAT